ncbi:DNA internalization-related competence protein ComEC/Rec2 [Ammoniphilus sp. YIM 78166]|uniref:DNA internalization-related competence protein ComEC/Rec2 n=1 Tax=Ammoniphilus sp. YIM 78166 TaxID=1644106 RepID=UPI00106F5549|nr:DNA internalization-related competence protein ComEC/Rec2 [Ammoniphilus sp. YIM 78166]
MQSRPLYWISLLVALGMILSHLARQGEYGYLLATLGGVLVCSGYSLLALAGRERLIAVLCFLAGFSYYAWVDGSNITMLKETDKEIIVSGVIASPPRVDGDLVRLQLKLTSAGGREVREKVEARILLQSQDEQTLARKLIVGEHLTFSARITPPDLPRNPGTFNYRQFLYNKKIHWIVHSSAWSKLEVRPASPWRLDVRLHQLRNFLSVSLERSFPEDAAKVMKALLLGIRSDLPITVTDVYSKLGLIHLLAISGLHMSIISGGIVAFLRFVGLTRETTNLATMGAIPIYIVLAGASPSIVRSGIMAMVVLWGLYLHRPREGLNLWGTALLIMLLIDPYYIWDIGFQLSFLVTWGLIQFVPLIMPWFSRFPLVISSLLAVSLTAQLVSFPLSIFYFHQYHLLSLAVNILFVPLFSLIIIPFGFALFVMGLIHPSLVWLWTVGIDQLLLGLGPILEKITVWPVFQLYIPSPPLWWLGLYYIVLYSGIWIIKRNKGFWLLSLGLVGITLFILQLDKNKVEITFLDVGQGDAIVVQMPQNLVYLIDGGGVLAYDKEDWKKRQKTFDPGKDILLPFLKSKGIQNIDKLIMTHGDVDHIGGLASIVREMPVGLALFNGIAPTGKEEKELFELLKEKGVPIYQGKRGMEWSEAADIKWKILHPGILQASASGNNQSLVLQLEAYHYKVMFTGDVEREGELEILENYSLAPVHVLKVAHHGSNTSTIEEWVKALQPAISVISAGQKNRYGHPHKQTVENLKAVPSRIYRTDEQGAVILELHPGKIRIWSYLQLFEKDRRQKDIRGGNTSD